MLLCGLHRAWAFNLASLLTEFCRAVLIFNRQVWPGAGALSIFTVLATFLAHQFWTLTGEARLMPLNTFMEHATISAVFIPVVGVGLRPRVPLDAPGEYR